MTTKPLNSAEIAQFLKDAPEWSLHEGKLYRKICFKNFIEAFGFMTKVAMISESMGHHPEWRNTFSNVIIELITHDLGSITNLDLQLALAIDNLLQAN